MCYANFVGPVIKIGNNDFAYDHQLLDFKLAISYSMNGENNLITNKTLIDLSLKLFGVYKELWDLVVANNDYFLINMIYQKVKSIWKYKQDKEPKTLKQLNSNYFNDYNSYYFIELDKSLNLLDMTRKIFKNSNISYLANSDKDEFLLEVVTVTTNFYSKGFIEINKSSIFFKNINYLNTEK